MNKTYLYRILAAAISLIGLTACTLKIASGDISTGWLTGDEVTQVTEDWNKENGLFQIPEISFDPDQMDLADSQIMVFANLSEPEDREIVARLVNFNANLEGLPEIDVYNSFSIANETNQEVKSRFISELPTVLVLREGKEIGRISGRPDDHVEERVVDLLNTQVYSEFG